jgi:hypothetical protein
MRTSRLRIVAIIACLAAGLLILWCLWVVYWRLMLVEGMTQILLTVQPGTRLDRVEAQLGATGRRSERGIKPYPDFLLVVGPTDCVVTVDSYQLDALGHPLDFWINKIVSLQCT